MRLILYYKLALKSIGIILNLNTVYLFIDLFVLFFCSNSSRMKKTLLLSRVGNSHIIDPFFWRINVSSVRPNAVLKRICHYPKQEKYS